MTTMMPDKLYRGDRRNNGALAEMHKSDGIISKLINGGDPAYVQRVGLLNALRIHIKADTEAEKVFHDKSSFISFTTDKNVALYYASAGKPEELMPSGSSQAYRYIFEFNINNEHLTRLGDGIFVLVFNHDPSLEVSDSPITTAALQFSRQTGYRKCEVCERGDLHRVLLINVVEFLQNYPQYQKTIEALLNAHRDNEWLVMPGDYYDRLRGTSARIPRSRIWIVEYFRLPSDPFIAPSMSDILGQDIAEWF